MAGPRIRRRGGAEAEAEAEADPEAGGETWARNRRRPRGGGSGGGGGGWSAPASVPPVLLPLHPWAASSTPEAAAERAPPLSFSR